MTDSAAPAHSPFTLDEIIAVVSDIARDEVSKDRFKALKMLTSLNQSVAAIPPPLTDDEVIERVIRLMKAAGPKLTRRAYRKAYPLKDRAPVYDQAEADELDIFIKGKIKALKTLKQFNAMFPEVRKETGGVPPGFPVGAGPESQMEWVQRAATKILVERHRRQLQEESSHEKSESEIERSGYEDD